MPGRVLVRYRSQNIADSRELDSSPLQARGREIPAKVERFDASDLVKGLRLVHVAPEDTLQAIAALKADPNVLYAEPDYILHTDNVPNDPSYSQMWGLKNIGQPINGFAGGVAGADIDAELAWNVTTGSSNVVVGIIDTGIDINHPDLTNNIWVNPGEVPNNGIDDDGDGYIDDVNGWDFLHNDKTVYDGPATCTDQSSSSFNHPVDDHGTHVAGTIGASGNNGVGVTGINWQVKLMSLKFLGPCGSGASSAALAGISYAVMMRNRGVNIRVLNNSWGGSGFSQSLLNGIQAANNVGILFVAAAGNETANNDQTPDYPASYNSPNIISVASTTRFDALSSFSNYGANTVHLAAPGSTIYSTTPGNTYSYFSGTSMATPHVSGVAALVCAAFPNISLQQLRATLIFSGDSLPVLATKSITGKRLNAYLALQSAAENDVTPPGAITDLHVASQNGRSITLAWTAPGDDDNSGTASLYDLSFTDASSSVSFALTKSTPGPVGTQQTATVNIPYRHPAGVIKIRTFDNAGNENTPATLSVTASLSAVDPYVVTESAASALSTGGTPLTLQDDDAYRTSYPLPFAFPFYGQTRSSVTISTNGALYFFAKSGNDAGSSISDLNNQAMIAGMWDDLRTDRLGGDVFVVQPDANRIIFRWQGSTFANEAQPVNFEVELRSDGTIVERYGDGNLGLAPVVGISAGEPDAYAVSSHTSETSVISLTNAQTVTFAPRAATKTDQSITFNTLPSKNFGDAPFTVNATASSNLPVSFQIKSGPATVSGNTVTITGTGSVTVTASQIGDATYNKAPDVDQSFAVNKATPVIAWNNPANITFGTALSATQLNAVANISGSYSYNPPAGTVLNVGNNQLSVLFTPSDTANYNSVSKTVQLTVANAPASVVSFSSSTYSVNEGDGRAVITVNRSDATSAATVGYATSDPAGLTNCNVTGTGIASSRCDYTTSYGTLRFAAGEASKTVSIPIVDDNFSEANENFTITLSSPSTGTTLGSISTATVTITDNASTGGNPIDGVAFFVRQNYIDFLGREPDSNGYKGWQDILNNCQAGDITCDRIEVSSKFFRSAEFQERGYYVYRFYSASFGRKPNYEEFIPDVAKVSGFLTDAEKEANKVAFVDEFMQRAEFKNKYDAQTTPTAYVDALLGTAGLPTHPSRAGWIAGLTNNTLTRARVLRELAESSELSQKYSVEAFVVMQYFGYLRRNPDSFYLKWIEIMNQDPANYRNMVNGFMNSTEYRNRFAP